MDIFRQFIDNPVRVWLALLLLGVGGIFALLNIGRLEDPAFTIKTDRGGGSVSGGIGSAGRGRGDATAGKRHSTAAVSG